MNLKRTIFFLMAFMAGYTFSAVSVTRADASQCVDCHTNPRKLIQITREIAKTRPPVESKSKGPG